MKKLHILGLGLFAVLAIYGVAATSAFALESVWLYAGVVPNKEEPVQTETVGVMLFEDMGAMPAAVECEDILGKGTVGAAGAGGGKLDLITEFTIVTTKCKIPALAEKLNGEKVTNLCSTFDATDFVKAVNLPWLTEITLSGGVFLDLILSGGAGIPGYKIECKTALGVLMGDTCTTEKVAATLNNVAGPPGDVDAVFPLAAEEGEFFNCTLGNNLEGLMVGEDLIFKEGGGALAVAEG